MPRDEATAMKSEFVAVDVETANADYATICSIGIARFADGSIVDEWYTLVDPEDEFDFINVAIHGIDAEDVAGAPKFPEVFSRVCGLLRDSFVVSHMPFDKLALAKAAARYKLPLLACQWIDSARIARRVWPQFSRRGYGLQSVAKHLSINFKAHHALEDAKAAGLILLQAMRESGYALDGLLDRQRQPINPEAGCYNVKKMDGDPNGPLFGETIVFTGGLTIMARSEAAKLAARAGCAVRTSVTKDTTLLCVGHVDPYKLKGEEQSLKHRKALESIRSGQAIRIVSESDFFRIVNTSN
jgi:DNA polymerase-3 subunit epsilon